MKWYEAVKLIISAIWAWVLSALGGADDCLVLLAVLVCCDVVSGCIKAGKKGTLSSREMRDGIFRKLLIFMVVAITVRVDKVLLGLLGEPITLFGREMSLRVLFIVYCCLEELISILENASALGVPIPKWLRNALKAAYKTASGESAPRFIVNWLKEKFGVDIDGKRGTRKEDKKQSDEDADKGGTN